MRAVSKRGPALDRGRPLTHRPLHLPTLATRFLVICALAAVPVAGHAQNVANGRGPDDVNQVTLNNLGTIYNSAIITTALAGAGFTVANGWTFTFAGNGNATAVSVAGDLTNPLYNAWVVNSPNVVGLDGNTRNRGVVNQDAGGSVFQLKYTPGATDPGSIHFLQAYSESFSGGAPTIALDNGGAANPWYDTLGVFGIQTLPNGANPNASWMQDTPYDIEPETNPETVDFSSSLNFNVMVAVDQVNPLNGAHNVTIYSGESWGHVYTTADAPEPTSILLLGSTMSVLIGGVVARKRAYRKAA